MELLNAIGAQRHSPGQGRVELLGSGPSVPTHRAHDLIDGSLDLRGQPGTLARLARIDGVDHESAGKGAESPREADRSGEGEAEKRSEEQPHDQSRSPT